MLSGGRAICGLGLAWFKEEHVAYGWQFPTTAQRYALLEDALQVLPLLWGPGNPPFEGQAISLPDTTCYPRPLQERLPILVGGGGERRTLRLAARYADAANVFGDATAVRRKAEVLRTHCLDVGRDPAEVDADPSVDGTRRHRRHSRWPGSSNACARGVRTPRGMPRTVNAGTVDDHIGRFRELAEAGARRSWSACLISPTPLPSSDLPRSSRRSDDHGQWHDRAVIGSGNGTVQLESRLR